MAIPFSSCAMKAATHLPEKSTIRLAMSLATAAAVVVASSGKCGAQTDGNDYLPFGIYEQMAPRATAIEPVATELPLKLNKGDRIALKGTKRWIC
jgi:hypothetical protein